MGGNRHLQTTGVVVMAVAEVLMVPRAPATASRSRPWRAARRCLATSTWGNPRESGAAQKKEAHGKAGNNFNH